VGPVRSRASDRGLGSRFRAQFGMIRVDHMISHSPNPTTSARKQALRVMSWNVWGGGRVREITEVAQLLRIDVFAVIGCASGRGRALIAALSEVGFTHHIQSQSSLGFSTFVSSRRPVSSVETSGCPHPGLWTPVCLDEGLIVGAVYVPLETRTDRSRKAEFWRWLLVEAERLKSRPAILVGDLNTGDQVLDRSGGMRFREGDAFDALGRSGWRDAFREMSPAVREYSWWSRVNGFRLDHGFVSPAGVEILAASYVREVGGHILAAPVRRPDRPAISDHAALVLEVAHVSRSEDLPTSE
jgi:endonuclease/exonuclease/phosphatase family metal-dependent hydrolase